MTPCAAKIFLNSAHTSSAQLFVIGGAFVLDSVVCYATFVRCLEFRDCLLFWSSKCIFSMGIAVGTSMAVCYMEEVHYMDGPLLEVPLYNVRLATVCIV